MKLVLKMDTEKLAYSGSMSNTQLSQADHYFMNRNSSVAFLHESVGNETMNKGTASYNCWQCTCSTHCRTHCGGELVASLSEQFK